MKRLSLATFLVLIAAMGWGQDKLLYATTFPSPYSPATGATLQLWGFEGDEVQEKVNYEFKGPSVDEINSVRVNFGSTIKAKWTLTALPSPPTVKAVYQTLTGSVVESLGTTPLVYTGKVTVVGGTTQTLTSGTLSQSAEWNLGSLWGADSTGTWWASYEYKPNLDAMFTYDSGLAIPRLAGPNYVFLPAKKVSLQLVKNNRLKVHLNQAELNGSTLRTTLTSPGGTTAATQSWQALSLWVDGVLQAPSALTKGTATAANGVRTESVSWAYVAGKKYQLQVVDQVGNSQSIWYPKQAYASEAVGKLVQISNGGSHTLVLKAGGSVWAWGQNTYGQLGVGNTTSNPTPIQVSGLSGVIAVSAGQRHNAALKADGSVWTWGRNDYGQLGTGNTTDSTTPVQVTGLSGVVAISAGSLHTTALKADGSVWAWGNNDIGQLGDWTNANRSFPIQVKGLSGVIAVSTGGSHSTALKADGTVWTWGRNDYGQLGNGNTTYSFRPVQAIGLSGVIAISAGSNHTTALLADGSLWSWGVNNSGQLGNGNTVNSTTPVRVTGLSGVIAISTGSSHSAALKADGSTWTWGSNFHGELGKEYIYNSSTPVQVTGISGVVALSGGLGHTTALKADGSMWAWGNNSSGQLGNGTTTSSPIPVRVLGLSPRVSLSAGLQHNVALKSDGSVWAWGRNDYGQLGSGTTNNSTTPVQTKGLSDVVSVSSGGYHTTALKADGSVWAWGYNGGGELGNGTFTPSTVPVQATGITNGIALSAGDQFTVVLKSDGSVWAWGNNGFGALGNGTTYSSNTPVPVTGLSRVVAILAGGVHSMALKADGSVWAWGRNNYGQVGDGTTINRSTPVQVAGLSDVIALSAGQFHSAALKADGSVWAWGYNELGQLGNGTNASSSTPIQVAGLSNVVAISAGVYHMMALKADGSVWAWGNNGTPNSSSTPVQITGLTGVVALSAGFAHSVALKEDGSIWTWGDNQLGQLGIGRTSNRSQPTRVSLPSLQYDNTPPEIVTNRPTSTWSNQPVTVTAVDHETDLDESATRYLKDGIWTSGSQVTLSSNGSVTFEATDLAGNQTQTEVVVSTIDLLPPAVPVVALSTTAKTRQVTLTASSTDTGGSGINDTSDWEYKLATGGTWIRLNQNSVTVTVNGTYFFRVRDRAGNLSPESAPAGVTNIDRDPPKLIIPGSSVKSFIGIAQTWSAGGVQMYDDSGSSVIGKYGFDSVPSKEFTLLNDTITLSELGLTAGNHQLRFMVTDEAGNFVQSPIYLITVDLTAPTAPTVTASTTLSTKSLTLTASTNDPNPDRNSWEYRLGTGPWLSAPSGVATVSVNGEYQFRFKDLAGNQGEASSPLAVTNIDNTAPDFQISSPESNQTTYIGTGQTWTATTRSWEDNSNQSLTGHYWFGTAVPATPATFTVSGNTLSLSGLNLTVQETKTLYLRATDQAGNTTTLGPYTVIVDLAAPAAPTVSASTSAWTKSLVLTAASNDPGKDSTTWQYRLLPSTTWLAGNPATVTANGEYRFRYKDLAGNVSNETAFVVDNIDNIAPTLAIMGPGQGELSYVGRSRTWTATGVTRSDNSNQPPAGQYWFNTSSVPPNPSSFNISDSAIMLTGIGLEEGPATLYLSTVDAAGNRSTILSFDVLVDLTPPSIEGTGPAFTKGPLWQSSLTASDANLATASAWIGTGTETALSLPVSPLALDVSALTTDGLYVAHLKAVDKAGNTTTSDVSFTLDRNPPSLAWDSGATGAQAWSSGDVTVGVRPAESPSNLTIQAAVTPVDAATVSTSVSGSAYQVIVTPKAGWVAPLDATLSVTVTDRAGNVSTALTKPLRFDNAPPEFQSIEIREDGTLVPITDYVTGLDDAVTLAVSDDSPLEYRFVLKETARAEGEVLVWSDWSPAATQALTIAQTAQSVRYLYTQARDAAGNLSVIHERVVRVDASSPGEPLITSTSHPRALAVTDAVSGKVALFRFQVSRSGPMGIQAFEWILLQGSSLPNPSIGTAIDPAIPSGQTVEDLSLPELLDNKPGEYYWLFSRVLAGNGKTGAWASYPFRIDSTAPANLKVTSPTHPVPGVRYKGRQIEFQWQQPLELTGIKAYTYRVTKFNSAGQSTVGDWVSTDRTQVSVLGSTSTGSVFFELRAEDWAQNVQEASLTASFDSTPPDGFVNFRAVPNTEQRSVSFAWDQYGEFPRDDISSLSQGLRVGTLLKKFDSATAKWVEWSRWSYTNDLSSLGFQGLELDANYLVVVAVEDEAGNRIENPVPFSIGANVPVLADYGVEFEENWNGWQVSGSTLYRGSDASIFAQSGNLKLQGTPLSLTDEGSQLAMESVPPSPSLWSPLPTVLRNPSAQYQWTASGFTGTGLGLILTPAGLTLDSLTLAHPFVAGQTLNYPIVQVGPAPQYRLSSAASAFTTSQNWVTDEGWNLGPVTGLALEGNGWRIPSQTNLSPPALAWSVSATTTPWTPMALTLRAGAIGSARSILDASVVQENFYLRAGSNLIRVAHAVISGDRLVVTEGYPQVQGIPDGALRVEDLQIDLDGKIWAGKRFRSLLSQSIETNFGVLTAGTNAVVIEANQLVLTEATLGQGANALVLEDLVLEQTGLATGFGTIQGSFEGTYSGFTLQASGGRFGQGTQVFSQATLFLNGYGQTSATLIDVEVRLDTKALVRVAHSTGSTVLNTGFGSGAVTATAFTLSPSGLTANLTATLPSGLTNAGSSALPLGVRSLTSTGIVGAAPQGQTYPALTTAGFTFTPTSVELVAAGLRFPQGVLSLPSAFTQKPSTFDGWTIKADGSTPAKGQASGSAALTRGPWTVTFATLQFSSLGLEGLASLVLPPALGASTIELSSVGISPSGALLSDPVTTTSLVLQLNQKDLSVAAGALVFQPTRLVISSASLSRTSAPALTLLNLEIPFGATSVTLGSVAGTFEKTYHGFTVTATASTINGANRVLTSPKLALGTYSAATVTLSGLEVSLDDDSLVVNGTATGLNQALNTPYGTGAVTATAFTLSPSGLTANLTATLPSGLTNAGSSALPLGVRSLTSTGVVGAAPQSQTYPALTTAGFTFTPTSVELVAAGLRFPQGVLSLPSAFTQKPSTFDGWTIKADGSTPAKGQASGSAALTRGLWTVTFPTLQFSSLGLEGLASLVLPPALGASTIELSSVGISPSGALLSDPVTTTSLVLQLNQKDLSVATGALVFQPTRLVISSASLARTSAPALTLLNLEIPFGATSVTLGSIAGTFEKAYHGFTVTASASTINGANRVLTSPKLALGTYSAATVTLSGLEVSLDDDSLVVNGTATGLNQALTTPYGTGAVTATAFTLSPSGLTANLTATLPSGLTNAGSSALPLGVRSLTSTGIVGAAPQGQTYPALAYRGYSFVPSTVSLVPSGLLFDSLQSELPAHFLFQTVTFGGWTILANGDTVSPGASTTAVPSRLGTWDVEFPLLRIEASGLVGEPKITLPPSLGSTEQALGTTVVNQNGTYTMNPVATTLPLELFGWTAQSSTLTLQGSEYRLAGVTIPLPGIFQSSDLVVGAVAIAQDGSLVSAGNGGDFNFRGTNGFRVAGTNAKISERGLAMGGKVFLPEALGGAEVNFPAGSIVLEPDGAVLAESNSASVTLSFLGWAMTTSGVTVDRRGLTIKGASVTPLGLVPITLPDFTIYSTGELAIGGESTESGSFPLASITVSYSGLRFDDGLHLNAEISFPPSWGRQSVVIDDLRVSPQGTISASGAIRDLNFGIKELGFDAHFDELRISREGFRLSGVELGFTSGVMTGKKLAVDAALLDYSGNLDLYGFSFGSFPLWGYQVNLDSLSIGPTGMGFSGGIRLADNLPIPELAGAYLKITSFKIGFDGNVQDLKVSIDQGFSFTVFDAWQVTINALEIDQHLLKIRNAQLQLPAGFQLGTLAVSGMTLNFLTGEIVWGSISVANAKYTWNGIVFTLTDLNISKTEGLVFAGSAAIPANTGAPNNTPYPKILQNTTLTVSRFQILPTGLPGTVTASLSNINGPLFDDVGSLLVSGGTVSFSNAAGNLVFGLGGKVKLGDKFPTGLNGLELDITKLVFNASTATLDALDVGVVKDFGEVPLFGYATFRPSAIRLTKTGPRDFEAGVAGKFRTGALPGALAHRDVDVQEFRIASNGAIQALSATLNLSNGSPLLEGITVDQGSVGILYQSTATPAARFTVQGKVKLGSGFMAGLAGTVLDIRKMEWTGTGTLIQLDVGTTWTGSKPFFGGAAIENGAINLSGSNGSPWTIGTMGVLVLPSTGVPEGLAGQRITIGTLVFTTAGAVEDVDISIAGLNINLFGAAKLSNGSLAFSRYDTDSFRIDVGGTMTLPPGMGAGLGGLPVSLSEFAFTTKGQVLALKGSIGSPASFELFAGVRATTGAFTFSQDGVAGSGSISVPSTMVEGLPNTIVIKKLLVGWNGTLKDLEAGVGAFNVTIGGFSTAINSLIVTESGVTIDKAVLTLPPNLGNRQVSIVNAGFNKNGGFTGTVGIDEINQDIAGFKLSLRNLSLDVGAKVLRIATSTIETPKIGTLNSKVQLNNTVIRPDGVALGGVGFSIPNFDYGGVAFRSIQVSFAVSGNSFSIDGSAQAEIVGLGILDAELGFANISNVYPIGLKRAYFQYTLSSGMPLGATGLFLNKIRGGFTYGPPGEVPADMRLAFDNQGPRLQLGVGVTSAAGAKALQMDADFWIDIKNGAWAFNGQATVLEGLATGRLGAAFGNNIFYGTFAFKLRFVNGQVQIWIFPYNGSTVLSGTGRLTFVMPPGSILDWTFYTPEGYWWGVRWNAHHILLPGSEMPIGNIEAEFGQFRQGAGAKGWVSAFGYSLGAFVDGGGMHFNIGDYSLIRPGN